MTNLKRRMENFAELIKAGINAEDARTLQRLCRMLHKRDELACEYDFGSDEAYAAEEKKVERMEKRAEKIAEKYGLLAYHQGDPRGWSLYLVKPESLGGYTIDQVYDRGQGVSIW